MPAKSLPAMPSPQKFLLDAPLYRIYKSNHAKVIELREFSDALDLYCVECGERSIFRQSKKPGFTLYEKHHLLFEMQFVCSRNDHYAVFYFRNGNDNTICKTGEFPSRADTFSDGIAEYKKILGGEYMSLQLAKRLYSQGIGAGAFVYLRRIFENVIVKRAAERKYKETSSWDYAEWKRKYHTMDKKLSDLSSELPDFINSTELFRVLSAAVHELDEVICLQHFALTEKAITKILDKEIFTKKEEEARKSINNEIKKLDNKIRKTAAF